jgi:hypothetical protein
MNHSSPTFTDRLRSALGLAETSSAGTSHTARPTGTYRQRGQVFADRLRKALDRD